MYHHLMSFYWNTNVGEYLFPGLNINGLQGLLLLIVALIIMSVTYEGVKVFQTQTKARTARENLRRVSCPASETANLLTVEVQNLRRNPSYYKKLLTIAGQAVVFLFHNTLGYVLMLSVMVYNGYVFIAVILGMGLGYFLFGHISMRINMENIRARTANVICSPKCPTEPTTSGTNTTDATGYIRDSLSSDSSTSINSNSNYTNTSQLPKEVDAYPSTPEDSNIVYSCRL